MYVKNFLLSVVMIVAAGAVHAQDKIYKRNGDIVEAKIKSVGVKTIAYVKYDNTSGPEYTVVKADVEKIMYQNGTVDEFAGRRMPQHPMRMHKVIQQDANDAATSHGRANMSYAPNLLAISPLQFTENGLGISLSYERRLDDNGIIAFCIPVVLTFDLNNGTYQDANGVTHNAHTDKMFYAMPGIKIYPTGSNGVVRYAVGPSLVAATGEKTDAYNGYNPYNPPQQTNTHVLLGIMVNNSLNINPSPRIYLGLDFGFGFTYLNRVAGLNQDSNGLVQGGFKIGLQILNTC